MVIGEIRQRIETMEANAAEASEAGLVCMLVQANADRVHLLKVVDALVDECYFEACPPGPCGRPCNPDDDEPITRTTCRGCWLKWADRKAGGEDNED